MSVEVPFHGLLNRLYFNSTISDSNIPPFTLTLYDICMDQTNMEPTHYLGMEKWTTLKKNHTNKLKVHMSMHRPLA
jgi:hypothetical protein